jgi:hypothetical protein
MDMLENADDAGGRTDRISRSMKADKSAAGVEKRSAKAFYPELREGKGALDLLHLLRKAEPAAPQREQFDENDRRAQGKFESWHAFQTP